MTGESNLSTCLYLNIHDKYVFNENGAIRASLFLCSITLIEKEHLATKPQSHKATKPWVHSVWSNRSTICSQISCICTHWIGVRSCFQTKNLKFVIIGKHKLRNRLVHISHQIIFAFKADPAALNKLNRIVIYSISPPNKKKKGCDKLNAGLI